MMETAQPLATNTELHNGKLSHASTEPNSDKSKRKSVSFVDEKLIMDALNSTAMSNGKTNGSSNHSSSFRHKPTNQEVRQQQANRAMNGGNGAKVYSNGTKHTSTHHHHHQRPANGATNGHSKGSPNYYKSPNGAAKNAVIVYYNDPQAEINVDQLLTKQQQPSEDKRHPASILAPKANGHQNNGKQNGGHAHKGSHEHASKYEDNWRGSAPQVKGDHHGKAQNGNVKSVNGKAHAQPRAANGKTNGSCEKAPATPKSEPITIYYSAPTSSEVIEHNLKELELKTNGSTQVSSNGQCDKAEKPSEAAVQEATPATTEQTAADVVAATATTESSQANVINGARMEVDSPQPAGIIPMPVPVVAGSGDQYDVISGGVPIEGPALPTDGDHHQVLCMLVSHPLHFYVRFVQPQYESQLVDMNHFYTSDEHEHIDLSVDVLKAGQYFAACRARPSDQRREWIRVQLLHVESPELINCLLIDEGCFGMFKLSDLQPLYNQFRSVPKQAIRASLAGVKPKESDWLPKQALEFKNLVADRKFHTGQQTFDQKTFDEKQSLEIELYFAGENDSEELKDKSVADIVVERDIASKK